MYLGYTVSTTNFKNSYVSDDGVAVDIKLDSQP
jgi:hypothetical protein